jgi:hypothetical protein
MMENHIQTPGAAMNQPTFESVKRSLEAACDLLRAFTLAHRGATPKQGLQDIRRVTAGCNRMDKLFATGPNAAKSKLLVTSARSKVMAAKARLAVLGVMV